MRKIAIRFHWLLLVLSASGLLAAEEGDNLAISNPFYRPYEGDFFLEANSTYNAQGRKVSIPAFSSSQETATKEMSTALALTYGIADFLAIGVYGKYMFRSELNTTNLGPAFTTTPSSSSNNSGFYDPGVQISGRLIGTRQEEWFLNIDLAFQPGIKDGNNDSFSSPHNQYLGAVSIGGHSSAWSYGALVTAQYYQPSSADTTNEKNDRLMNLSMLFVQHDFEYIYIRLSGGGSKFLDSKSNENAIKKRFFPTGQAELGVKISDSLILSGKLTYVAGTSGDMTIGNINASITTNPILMASLYVAAKF